MIFLSGIAWSQECRLIIPESSISVEDSESCSPISEEQFLRAFSMVIPEKSCKTTIALSDWKGRLSTQHQHPDAEVLQDLALDLPCLWPVPEQKELVQLWILQAWLADQQGDPVEPALVAAATTGAPQPFDAPDSLLDPIAEIWPETQGRKVRVVVAGGGGALDGGPLPSEQMQRLPQGKHTLNLPGGGSVLNLKQDSLIWLGKEMDPKAALENPLKKEYFPLLHAIQILSDGELRIYHEGSIYRVGTSEVEKLGAPMAVAVPPPVPSPVSPPPAAAPVRATPVVSTPAPSEGVDHWRTAYGLGLDGGWSNGVLIQGPGVGIGVYARWSLSSMAALSLSVWPLLVPVPAGLDGNVPLRLGLRLGPHQAAGSWELGVDGGVDWQGRYSPTAVGFLFLGTAGYNVRVAPKTGFRLEVWGGAGLGYAQGGLAIGVETRKGETLP